jgi:hypothetical protein
VQVNVSYDPAVSVTGPPEATTTITHVDESDPPVVVDTYVLPTTEGTTTRPVSFTASDGSATVTLGTPLCRESFPTSVQVTLGPESWFGSYAGATYTVHMAPGPPGYYDEHFGTSVPFLQLSVEYWFDSDNQPFAKIIARLWYASAVSSVTMSQVAGTALCPVAAQVATVPPAPAASALVEEPATPAACDITLGHYFQTPYPPELWIHMLVYDSSGTTLVAESPPVTGATYTQASGFTILGDVNLYRYDATVSGVTPGITYLIRTYSSPRSGYPAGDGPRTAIGDELVRLECTRLAFLGCGFDGPDVGTILDENGLAEFTDWRFGFFGPHGYENALLGNSVVVLKDGGTPVASGTLDSQGFLYLAYTPTPAHTYTLEITPTAFSGYPPHAFEVSTVPDYDVNRKSFDEPIRLDKGVDYIVDGCGCGVAGAELTLVRTAIGDPGTVLRTETLEADIHGYAHFNWQLLPGDYTVSASADLYAGGPFSSNDFTIYPDATDENCEFASSSVYETYMRLDLPQEIGTFDPAWSDRFCHGGAPPRCLDPLPSVLYITLGPESYYSVHAGVMFMISRSHDFHAGWKLQYTSVNPWIYITIRDSNDGTCDEPDARITVELIFTGGVGNRTITLGQDSGSSACPVAYTASRISGHVGPATAAVSD